MKKIVITGFIVTLCMLLIPLSAGKGKKTNETRAVAAVKTDVKEETVSEETGEETGGTVTFRIKTKDKIITLSAYNYIIGVVAAEMPPSYGAEALKAQSVAAYSFALYKKERASGAFDLTDSYKTDQSYLSEAALKEKWGDAYQKSIENVKAAVSAVEGEYLSFEGKPALTLYHALSPGKTNSCLDVFGSDISYLKGVNSKSDALSPDSKTVFKFSEEELDKKLSSLGKAKGKDAFSDLSAAGNGFVKEIKFGGKSVSGVTLAGLLGLCSPNFTVEYSSGEYVFTCAGRGHGVGMSQYGANQMALSGSGYREILAHFYPGTTLKSEK